MSEHDLQDLFKQNLPPVELPETVADQLHARVLNEVHTTLHAPEFAQLAVPPMGLPAETPRPADELAPAQTRSGSSRPAGRLADWFAGLRLAPSMLFMAATAAILLVALLMMPQLLDGLRGPTQPTTSTQPEQLPLIQATAQFGVPVIISGGDAEIVRASGQVDTFAGATATSIQAGDRLVTKAGSAQINFDTGQSSEIGPDSDVLVTTLAMEDAGLVVELEQFSGSTHHILDRAPGQFRVTNPLGSVDAELADFTVSLAADGALDVAVNSGDVTLATAEATTTLNAGDTAVVREGAAPVIQSRSDGVSTEPTADIGTPTEPTATAVALVLVPTATPTVTPTATPATAAAGAPASPTPRSAATATRTPTTAAAPQGATGGGMPTAAPTATPAPQSTQAGNNTGSAPTATNTPGVDLRPTATNTPRPQPSTTPTATRTRLASATPTALSGGGAMATNTPRPTATNTPLPTATNTPRPTATNTSVPTATNTPRPTATNTPLPTATNTPRPTATNTPLPLNHAPDVRNEENLVLNEDSRLTIPVLSNDSDRDGDSIAIAAVENGQNGTVINNQDNTLTYIPAPDFTGADSFQYQVTDGKLTSTGTVTLNVRPVNDPPRFSLSATQLTSAEDAGAQTIAGWMQSISPGAANESTQGLRAEITVDNPALFAALPTVDVTSGTLTYQSAPDASGTAAGTVTLIDGEGAASVAQAFTVVVTPVNDPPTFEISNGQITVNEDSGAQVVEGWLVNARSGPANEADQTLRADITVANPALFAAAPTVDPQSGAMRFTPAENAAGSTTANVVVTDSAGASSAARAFTITIAPQNDAPTARDDAFTVPANGVLTGNVLGDNGAGADSDLDGDALQVVTVNGGAIPVGGETTLPSGAHVTLGGDGALRYDPAGAFTGLAAGQSTQEQFTYTVSDNRGGTARATVRVTVQGVNDAP
ncbi:MAG: tandem-95 repeat protein, partial [Caldilineaceae bacterium]|nr:tandem-95 repeat protein [Caldilineaceae bacterium]